MALITFIIRNTMDGNCFLEFAHLIYFFVSILSVLPFSMDFSLNSAQIGPIEGSDHKNY